MVMTAQILMDNGNTKYTVRCVYKRGEFGVTVSTRPMLTHLPTGICLSGPFRFLLSEDVLIDAVDWLCESHLGRHLSEGCRARLTAYCANEPFSISPALDSAFLEGLEDVYDRNKGE